MRIEGLIAATVVSLVVGCATPSPSPPLAPSPMPEWMSEIDWDPLRTPLQLPTLQAGEQCPVTPASTTSVPNVSSVLGDGPVFPWGTGRAPLGELFFDGEVHRLKVLWIIDPDRYAGPALIRGARIDSPSPTPLTFFYADEGPYGELRLGRQGWVYGGTGMHEFNSETGFPGVGCFAYQVDGLGFHETIVVEILDSSTANSG